MHYSQAVYNATTSTWSTVNLASLLDITDGSDEGKQFIVGLIYGANNEVVKLPYDYPDNKEPRTLKIARSYSLHVLHREDLCGIQFGTKVKKLNPIRFAPRVFCSCGREKIVRSVAGEE